VLQSEVLTTTGTPVSRLGVNTTFAPLPLSVVVVVVSGCPVKVAIGTVLTVPVAFVVGLASANASAEPDSAAKTAKPAATASRFMVCHSPWYLKLSRL
jgi:hypothetical protein